MFSAKDRLKEKLNILENRVSDTFDFDFSAVSRRIDTVEDFNELLMKDYNSGKQLFYRGERINDPNRHLLPTMLRNPDMLFGDNDLGIVHVDADYLLNYYSNLGSFVDVFSKTMGEVSTKSLYEICAFSQHYNNFSPLIDFTKSIYPSLSFALKDRETYEDDIILYVIEIKNDNDYTTDIDTANKWLSELSIYAGRFEEIDIKNALKDIVSNRHRINVTEDFENYIDFMNSRPSPKAKLIDVPTNTRMKFQQGVFLMLTDFHFFNVTYFTKNLRDDFEITKFIINKDICPYLLKLIQENTPWYEFKYLTDVESAFKTAININDD